MQMPNLPSMDGDIQYDGGVSEHSSNERYIIFSVFDAHVYSSVDALKKENIGFKQLKGKYKGVEETSFIVNARNFDKVCSLGLLDGQETILYLWPMSYGYAHYGIEARPATLYSLQGYVSMDLGLLVAINDSDLPKYQDWTFDPTTKTYYVIRTIEGKDGSFTE